MGGQNGVTFSNTLLFEYCLGWSGILIEANPINFERMHKQRPCTDNYWTAACPRQSKYMFMNAAKGNSDISETQRSTHSLMVPCRSLASIFRDADVTWIDFFSLDVERAELITLQTIDFTKVQIGVLLIERSDSDLEIEKILTDTAGMIKLKSDGTLLPDCQMKAKPQLKSGYSSLIVHFLFID